MISTTIRDHFRIAKLLIPVPPIVDRYIRAILAVNHTLFSSPEPYARRASALALEDLASRVSVALKKHPEWFPR